MNYRSLGRTGLEVSELCLGTMTFAHPTIGCDESTAHAIVHRFLDAGGNFIDTADIYQHGVAEEIVGRALAGRRERVLIATKVAAPMGPGPNDLGLSRLRIRSAVDASLTRLGTDWIDLYQTHFWDPTTPIDETLRALDDCVRAGKVRYVGCSNHYAWQLMKAVALSGELGLARYDCLQPEYSLACRAVERELLPLCLDQRIGVIPWSPLAGGLLARPVHADGHPTAGSRFATEQISARRWTTRNLDVARAVNRIADALHVPMPAVALGWLIHRPGVTASIVGARSVAQLEQSLRAVDLHLSDQHLRVLDEVSALPMEHPTDINAEVLAALGERGLRP